MDKDFKDSDWPTQPQKTITVASEKRAVELSSLSVDEMNQLITACGFSPSTALRRLMVETVLASREKEFANG